jgi:drug/metabolite transporter (DMT)-like permease
MVNVFALSFTGCGVCFKIGQDYDLNVGDFQIFRAAVMFLVMSAGFPMLKIHPVKDLPISNKWVVALRSFFGVMCFLTYNIALTLIPLAFVIILQNLAPFWTAIFASWLNKEPIFLLEYLSMFACLTLIIIMSTANADESSVSLPGILVAIASSFCMSGLQITNRRLKGTSFLVLNWWHSILGFIFPFIGFGIYAWVN